jgi:cobalamin biosynthesis Mg chelatase CobN
VNALGQAMAQQQFNALVDIMTYDELYEYFGGAYAALHTYSATHPMKLPSASILKNDSNSNGLFTHHDRSS